jgi:predicted TIM-barrel fold metal-dependent hydrolase
MKRPKIAGCHGKPNRKKAITPMESHPMMLQKKLPALNDAEGLAVPIDLPPVIDAHVHVFPEKIFKSVWKWFDEYGWPVRYQLRASDILSFLLSRGVRHVVALQYAHKPGISRELNTFMVRLCHQFPGQVTGLATVFPGEAGALEILKDAFSQGLTGVKLHAHVQCFDMNSLDMDRIYELCSSENKPLLMHVGREPKSPAYACDPYVLCRAGKLERVIQHFPELKVCVPHLGMGEYAAYQQLIRRYDNLWLDTAMALTDYLPGNQPIALTEMRTDRILYGSDFPNIPFSWDRELRWLQRLPLSEKALSLILSRNAAQFYQISTSPDTPR